jgi:hypothetical protein
VSELSADDPLASADAVAALDASDIAATAPAVKPIAARAGDQQVVAGAAGDCVRAAAAQKHVVAGVT